MKRYWHENTQLIIGNAREIGLRERLIYDEGYVRPSHCDRPKFNSDRMYGLYIDYDEGTYMVVSASTALRLLTEYDFVED